VCLANGAIVYDFDSLKSTLLLNNFCFVSVCRRTRYGGAQGASSTSQLGGARRLALSDLKPTSRARVAYSPASVLLQGVTIKPFPHIIKQNSGRLLNHLTQHRLRNLFRGARGLLTSKGRSYGLRLFHLRDT